MEPQVTLKNRSENKLPSLVKNLSTNLSTLQPDQSQTTKLITYALLATAVVGIMVYHYIKQNEADD